MRRAILAIGDREFSAAIRGALERAGIAPAVCCGTGAEALRAARRLDGVVVCSYRLPDMTAGELSEALGQSAPLLVLGRPQELSLLRAESAYRLAVPVRRSELLGAVGMLLGRAAPRRAGAAPSRPAEERERIERAKALLMEHGGLTEQEAHRCLQRRSMDACRSMAATAGDVIASFEQENV